MICKKPFMAGLTAFGCGQCLPCRIARRKLWTNRQVLESLCHEENSFVTLTYEDASVPQGNTLKPTDLRDFLKRLRSSVSPIKLRFYGVGEYGDETQRPHYHLSLFGLSGRTDIRTRSGDVQHWGCSAVVQKCWPHGFTHTQEFTRETAQYTAGYVTKKLTSRSDPRLAGRHPEFARMSLRPGIGAPSIPQLVSSLQGHTDFESGRSLRINGKLEFIGPYLCRLLADSRFDPSILQRLKDEKSHERSLEMLALHQTHGGLTPRASFQKSIEQKILTVEARNKIHSSRRTL